MPDKSSPVSTIRSIFLLLIAFFIFAIQDVIIKMMSGSYALLQIVTIRTLFVLPIVAVLLYFNGGLASLKTSNLKVQLIRGGTMFAAYIFFFMALSAIPYSLNNALFFSGPLFITLLSIPILKEKVGWLRGGAVIAGFVGVIIAVNPAGAHFDPAAFLSVASALTYAMSIIATRILDDTPQSITAYTTGVYLLGCLLLGPIFANINSTSTHPSIEFLTKAWVTPTSRDTLLILLIAFCWGLGMVMLSAAYRDTPVAILAPFEYFSIAYGLFFGYLFWREIPTLSMLIGVTLIVVSGLFIIYRENRTVQFPQKTT